MENNQRDPVTGDKKIFPARFQPGVFTPRELEIAELLAAGVSTAEILAKLAISRNTLKSHLHHIYLKSGTGNRIEFTLSVMKEITRENAAKEGTQRLQAFIQQSLDGIVIINNEGIILEWNAGEERITGIPASAALGCPLWEIQARLIPEEKQSASAAFKDMARAKIAKGFSEGIELKRILEEEIQRPDGSRRKIQSMVFAIPTGDRMLAGGITRDITEL